MPIGIHSLRQIPDFLKLWYAVIPERRIQLFLKLWNDVWRLQTMVEDGTASITCRVASGDQLCKSFSSKLFATHLFTFCVSTFHQTRKQINAIDLVGIVNTFLHTSNGDPCEVLYSLNAFGEERIGQSLRVRFEGRKTTNGSVFMSDSHLRC